MRGILSPNGESVLHDSTWITAILSPDESMYFHEGKWYKLDQNSSTTSEDTKNMIPKKTKQRVPRHYPHLDETRERGRHGKLHQENHDSWTGKIIAAILTVFLLWFVFDSGKIISYADLASMDCSVWTDDEYFDWSDVRSGCDDAKSQAQVVVTGGLLGTLICVLYIVAPSKNKRQMETLREYKNTNLYPEIQERNQRKEKILELKKEVTYLKERIALVKDIESTQVELTDASLNWQNSREQWDKIFPKIVDKRRNYSIITITAILIGMLLSFGIFVLFSSGYVGINNSLGRIFPYIAYIFCMIPVVIFIRMNSNRIIEADDPLLKLRNSIPVLEKQVGNKESALHNLDSTNKVRGIVMARTIKQMEKRLETLQRDIQRYRTEEF